MLNRRDNLDLLKKENETPLQYHKRLVYGKLVDKTLDDIDYSELAELLYGKQYASDVARRMVYGSRKTLELMDEQVIEGSSDQDVNSEIDYKIAELKKERQKFFDQRREYSKMIANDGRREHMYESLAESASKLNETIGKRYTGHCGISEPSGNDAVLVLSDWHYGLVADNVFNKYDTEICKERIKTVFNKAAERIIAHNCDQLHIVVLGDLIHGAIHTSARVASEELTCDQIMQVAELLAQSIEWIGECAPVIRVYTTYGNHARTIQNKHDSIHRDNMERIIPWWLKQRLAIHDNIYIDDESENEFIFVNASGHFICASHGDLDSISSSPRLLSTLFNKKYGINVECILLGDKHHHESFEELGTTAIVCGSLCGTDDYANNKRLFSRPEQLLLIVNENVGVDAEYRLSC